jgi:hypothetical protein
MNPKIIRRGTSLCVESSPLLAESPSPFGPMTTMPKLPPSFEQDVESLSSSSSFHLDQPWRNSKPPQNENAAALKNLRLRKTSKGFETQ